MPPRLALRRFDPADLATLHRIRLAAFAPIFAAFRTIVGPRIAALAMTDEETAQGQQLDRIAAQDSGHHLFIVEADGEAVGFVSFSFDETKRIGEIGLNAVHPDHAGRGIGTWMYGEALARMKALGAEVVTVGTGGDPSHAAARRAYEKAGFLAGIPSVHLYRAV